MSDLTDKITWTSCVKGKTRTKL